jgi:hypothetical protein
MSKDHLVSQKPLISKRSNLGYWIGGIIMLAILIGGIIALSHYMNTTSVPAQECPGGLPQPCDRG